jgi:general secretion pathway protein D
MIEVGTANAIQLRPLSTKATEQQGEGPGAGPGNAPAQGVAPAQGPATVPPAGAPATPPMPPAPPQPGVPPSSTNAAPETGGGAATFAFDPPAITQPKGATFTMNIQVSGVQNVLSVPLQMSYDPAKLELVNVSNGGFLSQDGQAVALVHRGDEATGSVQITATRPPGAGGVSGQGSVVTLTFLAKSAGQAPVTIIRGGARDPSMQAIPVNGAQAVVTIQ